MENKQDTLISELVTLIEKGNAHMPFEEVVAGLDQDLLTKTPDGLPYNIWQVAQHMRITLNDILQFCIDPSYESPEWPKGYWTEPKDHVSEVEWKNCLDQIRDDQAKFIQLLKEPNVDLYTPFEHGTGQNLLREALLIADHNAYHTGQIVVLRRLLGAWDA